MEDSAPATQTQKAVTDAITKNTLSMIGYAPYCLHLLYKVLGLHADPTLEESLSVLFVCTGKFYILYASPDGLMGVSCCTYIMCTQFQSSEVRTRSLNTGRSDLV